MLLLYHSLGASFGPQCKEKNAREIKVLKLQMCSEKRESETVRLMNREQFIQSVLLCTTPLCVGYSPESLSFLEGRVNQADQQDPKSERQRDRGRKKVMLERERERE